MVENLKKTYTLFQKSSNIKPFWSLASATGASSRNFLAKKYPWSKKVLLRKTFEKFLFFILFVFIIPNISFAQFNIDNIFNLSDELGVEIIPNYPKPYENVFMGLSMYTADLNSAKISWFVNNKLERSGIGSKEHSFYLGEAGSKTDIKIEIELKNGSVFNKSFTFNPAEVDLVWEAISHTPPFYKGKAFHSFQGLVKVVAMPNFIINNKPISPKNLIYTWSNGENVYQNQSGYGKNVIIFKGSILGEKEEIRLFVEDPNNNLVAESFLDIYPKETELIFYENDSYYGYNFEKALSQLYVLKKEELQIIAEPFYVSLDDSSKIKYTWLLNGKTITDLNDSRNAIFRKIEESGNSKLSLRFENPIKILQSAENNILIQFSK